MAKILYGDRIGRSGRVMLGCSALLFDATREQILLTRRTDNGRWCLPGGRVDPGETVAEACVREMLEETGLQVQVERLIGVYSDPNFILQYADGERCHVVALHFEVKAIGGTLSLSNETTEYGYFTWDNIQTMDVMEHHQERIRDAIFTPSLPVIK